MPSADRNLVLVPGLICDQEVWAHGRAYLSDVADITIAPADETDTMQGLAEAVLDLAPKTFAIAGFSMGGYVALEVLRQAPHRVERIALLDTSGVATRRRRRRAGTRPLPIARVTVSMI